MSEAEIVKEYGSSVLNYLLLPLIGLSVIFMGVVPFLIAGGFNVGTGGLIFGLIAIGGGIVMTIFPFTYKLFLTEDSIVYKRVWGEKEVFLDGVSEVGQVEHRVMNGAPIAVNKVTLIRSDGSSFELSLRNIGKDNAEEIISYIYQNIPYPEAA